MNVTLPKKEKTDIKAVIIYTISIISCIIAAIVVAISQYLGTDELERILSVGGSNMTQEDIDEQILISGFDNIFNNQLEQYNLNIDINKKDEEKEIIYTGYENQESKENDYDLDLHIPYINIDDEKIENMNNDIKETFENKAENVLQSEKQNVIYTVQYEATIENDILSLIIKSNLKQSTSAQRLIIRTYNYDLKNKKEITLQELINKNGLNENDVQNKIKQEIENEQKKVEDLKSLGYEIFERDLESEIYNIENSDEFFIKDGKIYIIYPYGNNDLTSEMDLVII
mgnify:FL=1